MNKHPNSQKIRRLSALAAVLFAATVALLVSAGRQQPLPVSADGELAGGAVPGAPQAPSLAEPARRSGDLVESTPPSGDRVDPASLPAGQYAVRRVSLDEERAKLMLPTISPVMAEVDEFPELSAEDAADPGLKTIHEAQHEQHRMETFAAHEDLEAERFALAATKATTDAERKDLLEASAGHQRLADGMRRRAARMRELAVERTAIYIDRARVEE